MIQEQNKKIVSKKEIKKLLDFERLITGLSSKFINLPAEEVNAEIKNALKQVVDFFGADRGTLYHITQDRKNTEFVQTYTTEGTKPLPRLKASILYPYFWPRILSGIPVIVSNVEELQEEAAVDRESLIKLGVRSSLVIPIKDSGQFNYAISMVSLHDHNEWNPVLVNRLQLIGEILVTELKREQTEEELKLKERAIETSISGIGITDLDGRLIYFNRSILKMWGYDSEDEILGRSLFEFFEIDRVTLIIEELKKTGGAIGEEKGKRKDGSLFDVQYSASIISDKNGDPKYMFGSFIDITENKKEREALKKSERSLAEAQRIAHLGNWEWDMVNNTHKNSEEIFRIFGLDQEQTISTENTFLECIHPLDKQRVGEANNSALTNPEYEYNIEYRIIRPDGEERTIHAQLEVFFNEKNKPVKMLGTVHDITEIKRIEDESAKLMNDLAHIERIGTVGAMTAALAHEINQPLAAILSNAQAGLRYLKQDEPDLTEIKEILIDIVSDNKRAGNVINRLRSLVKKSDVLNEPYHLNLLINEVLNLLRSEILLRKTTVIVELDSSVQQFIGDRIQMQQVVLNLLMNALDAVMARPKDMRNLKIITSAEDEGGVMVSVVDSGTGVEEENMDELFEAFYSTKDKGMGMGLPICKSIIEANGGRIWAEKLEQTGTKFSFWLPYNTKKSYSK